MEPGVARRVQGVDLTELYQAHFRVVWRTLQFAGVRDADLDDATQEVFLVIRRKLLTSIPVLSTPGMSPADYERAWSSWIIGVAINEVKNYRRRSNRRREDPIDNADDILDLRDAAEQCEARDLLLLLLMATKPNRRILLMLVEMEGYTVAEAARILEITETTANKRLRQARDDLKEAMGVLKQHEETSRTQRKSGALLLPLGTGAWINLRGVLDPPAGTAERVWQSIQASIERNDEERERPPSSRPSPPPPVQPPVSSPRSLRGLVKSALTHLLSAGIGAAVTLWILWPRPIARIAVLQVPVPVPTATSSTQAPTTTVLNVADLPFVTSPVLATPSAQAKFDPVQVRMIKQAYAAYNSGDVARTFAALDAYDALFPAGQFRTDSQGLRKRAQSTR